MTNRPLSPHLQIYRLQLTSCLSILHRISGMIIMIGTWLVSTMVSWSILYPASWNALYQSLPKWAVFCLLFPIAAALCYHWLNGIRHLLWDKLIGLELPQVYRSGYIMLSLFIASIIAILYLSLT